MSAYGHISSMRTLKSAKNSTEIMIVSFVIPSYNSAHTVKRCLDSIYALPLKPEEFEVIFIDDCSTDNTCEIVETYFQPLPDGKGVHNLVLLRQPQNNRQGAARNRGVREAKGEFICFIDSDDTVAEGIVAAIRMAKENKTDMTAFHFVIANEKGQIKREKEHLSFTPNQLFSGVKMQSKYPYWCSAPWAYVYRKEFLDKVGYPFCEGVLYEDADFIVAHLLYARRMAYSLQTGYIVHSHAESSSHSVGFKNKADYLLLGTRMLSLYTTIQKDIERNKYAEDGLSEFAASVLEGACHNVTRSLNGLYKLKNRKEIVAYYDRVDTYVDRRALYEDKRMHEFQMYWKKLSIIGIKFKYLSIYLNSTISFLFKVYMCIKNMKTP